MTLPQRQTEVMLFIQRHYVRTGRAPTLDEICAGVGISSKGRMHGLVSDLCAAGHLERTPERHRGITILKPIADDRMEDAARRVCSALGIVTPDNISKVREALHAALLSEAA